MVEAIIRLTAAAVLMLALVNVAQGLALVLRMGHRASAQYTRLGTRLWLPLFASLEDAQHWLAAWREILSSPDPALVALRVEGRTIVMRYFMLMIASNGWALAVWAILLPSLA